MISFILIAAVATIATIVLLAWPLIKTSNTDSYERHTQNIHFARERLSELEQQRNNAAISDSDYEALKFEIESTLAEDIDLADETQLSVQPARLISDGVLIALLCGLVPFAALVLYQITGTPQALQLQPTTAQSSAGEPGQQAASQQEIDSMVSSLEERLQSNPGDIEGWSMLARTYLVLGRYPEAIKANTTLLEIGGENPDVYAALADASALQAGGNLAGQPGVYIERALALNPQHPQALWLAGLSAAQQGDNLSARKYWDQLMPLLDAVPAQQDELRKIIKQTFDQPALPQSGQQTGQQTGQISEAEGAAASPPGLRVYVTLSAAMAERVNPSDIVFVFARAQNGPPAPLAVKRLRVADLPTEVSLSDADGMMAQFKLSLFENVLVSARVAKSGNPVAQAGDIQSASIASKNNNADLIELEIQEILK